MQHAHHTRSSQRSSFQTTSTPHHVSVSVPIIVGPVPTRTGTSAKYQIPISAFNRQVIEEAKKLGRVLEREREKERNDVGFVEGGGERRAVKGRGRTGKRARDDGIRTSHSQPHNQSHRHGHYRSLSVRTTPLFEGLNARRTNKSRLSISEQPKIPYTRPTGAELVSPRIPSCIRLPSSWTTIHDRFIAYLATHAPLEVGGTVPRCEERVERWRVENMVEELGARFVELRGAIRANMIERRLTLLDMAGDNDYFDAPYGAYMYEEWGRGI